MGASCVVYGVVVVIVIVIVIVIVVVVVPSSCVVYETSDHVHYGGPHIHSATVVLVCWF